VVPYPPCWSGEGLAFISKLESYAGASLDADRATHARKASKKFSQKESYPGSPGWVLGHGDKDSTPLKNVPDITNFDYLANTRTCDWERGIYFPFWRETFNKMI
jgi:hypothetical protein